MNHAVFKPVFEVLLPQYRRFLLQPGAATADRGLAQATKRENRYRGGAKTHLVKYARVWLLRSASTASPSTS